MSISFEQLIEKVKARDPNQKEFLEAFDEVMQSLKLVFERDPKYLKVMERLAEPERAIQFRVPWVDRNGDIQVNRGFRVQYNQAIGPYKGGLRFHPSVNLSIIKFLGFEQVFKNSLTGLMMGGGKGGSDFDPKGKNDAEVMSFCQSFILELYRHIGENTDIPAGDIGVGGREIGFMFGMYKRITKNFVGVLTGKGLNWGGSLIRPEATGYGAVYFAHNMLKGLKKMDMTGKVATISGSGNVAQFACEKVLDLGGKPISFSDSQGSVIKEAGFTREDLKVLMELKNIQRGRLSALKVDGAKYFAGKRPWFAKCDIALPSATQGEIDENDAKALIANGCFVVSEGANMPCTPEAIKIFKDAKVLYGPGKAANAGGVAVSGLEMSQNSQRLPWTREEVDGKLKTIMQNIYNSAERAAIEYGVPGDIQVGANIAGFLKVANTMIDQGCV